MTPLAENVLRSVARECRKAITAAHKASPKDEHDAITAELLDRYARKVSDLPLSKFSPRLWLAYYIRLIGLEARGKV